MKPNNPLDPFPLRFDPEKLLHLQEDYLKRLQNLLREGFKPHTISDRRFNSEAWTQNALSSFAADWYLLHADCLSAMVDTLNVPDQKTRARIAFAVEQWLDAQSPANFLLSNPEAIRKAIETEGQSIALGIKNLLRDLSRGYIAQTNEEVFTVGSSIASTEGAIVFENDFFQLIEYKPLSEQVYERPFLFVPPCINKYYILDLQPNNSLIRYVVSQGYRTFVLSWRNPDEALRHATWSDYVENAVIEAIHRVQAICNVEKINTLGFCVGGTLLSTALALMAKRKDTSVASATFLTTLMNFTHTGILDIFIDEGFVRFRENQFKQGGLLSGRELATTFNFLRPNDLVWNYVQSNYMLGKTPPAFDLLYWNADSTNLPGPLYAWYLRNLYLENRLATPGKCSVSGVPLDLSDIKMPVYLYASREDHIVPVEGAYDSAALLPHADITFVVGASGHIAGVINPPQNNKRSYWVQGLQKNASGKNTKSKKKLPMRYEEWMAQSQEIPGSWWGHWAQWLAAQSGKKIAAPRKYGSKQYPVIEAAPGRYVQKRI